MKPECPITVLWVQIYSFSPATLGKQEQLRGEGAGVNLGKHRIVVKEASSEVSSLWVRRTLKEPRAPPQPYWVSLAGRRHPSERERVAVEGMEQDAEREGGGRRERA